MTTAPEVFCDCAGRVPWPAMRRLHVASLNRYYACPECGAVREHVCRADGTIVETRTHVALDGLPDVVVEQVRALLERPTWEQGSFFQGSEDIRQQSRTGYNLTDYSY